MNLIPSPIRAAFNAAVNLIEAEIAALPAAARTPPGKVMSVCALIVGAVVGMHDPAIIYFIALAVLAIGVITSDLPRGGIALKVAICASLGAIATASRLLS